jgi:transcriptional regulator with XRE-family HTH domain
LSQRRAGDRRKLVNEFDPVTLGGRLRRARLNVPMSQAELEALSGIPKPRLSRYENNHIEPSISSLLKLCAALNVRPGSLLDPIDAASADLLE